MRIYGCNGSGNGNEIPRKESNPRRRGAETITSIRVLTDQARDARYDLVMCENPIALAAEPVRSDLTQSGCVRQRLECPRTQHK
jgi:hypothetical protein